MRIFLSSLFLAALIPACANAQPKNAWDAHPEWFLCQEDDQCAVTCETCGNVAINKKNVEHSKEVLPAGLQSTPCFPEATGKCVDQRCVGELPEKNK